MEPIKLQLRVLPSIYAVSRFEAHTEIPSWALSGDFFTVSKTQDELSIVSMADQVPPKIKTEKDWRIFKIEGPFAFTQIGILNAVTSSLAQNQISLFAMSTFDTDYIMVKSKDLDQAIRVLREAQHHVDDCAR